MPKFLETLARNPVVAGALIAALVAGLIVFVGGFPGWLAQGGAVKAFNVLVAFGLFILAIPAVRYLSLTLSPQKHKDMIDALRKDPMAASVRATGIILACAIVVGLVYA